MAMIEAPQYQPLNNTTSDPNENNQNKNIQKPNTRASIHGSGEPAIDGDEHGEDLSGEHSNDEPERGAVGEEGLGQARAEDHEVRG